MKHNKLNCPMCHASMKKVLTTNSMKGKHESFKARRWECTQCEYKETIYGSGERDTQGDPDYAKQIAEWENNRQIRNPK